MAVFRYLTYLEWKKHTSLVYSKALKMKIFRPVFLRLFLITRILYLPFVVLWGLEAEENSFRIIWLKQGIEYRGYFQFFWLILCALFYSFNSYFLIGAEGLAHPWFFLLLYNICWSKACLLFCPLFSFKFLDNNVRVFFCG